MVGLNKEADRLLRLFADMLDYPAPGLAEKASECEELVSSIAPPEMVPLMRAFRTFAEETPQGRLEEVYTGFFDLNPVCHPYVGYQLFGESYKRSSFLLGLKGLYRAEGFQFSESELPDRLSVMLRFVAHSRDGDLKEELLRDGLLPALERMTKKAESDGSPPPKQQVGQGDVQLEGHSKGEVLAGGFVLEMAEGTTNEGPLRTEEHPYRQALRGLKTVLEAMTKAQSSSSGLVSQEGGDHVR